MRSVRTKYSRSRGLSIIEIVVGAAIIVTVVTGISAAWQSYLKVTAASTVKTQAALLAEEAAEALAIIRDTSWVTNISGLTLGTPYHLVWNPATYAYSLTTDPTPVSGFLRTIVFSEALRDASSNIASFGTPDPGTRKVLITVSLTSDPASPILQAEMLLHNVFNY